MKQYIKAEKSLLDNFYVDRLSQRISKCATACNDVGLSIRDLFEWNDNQYHNEMYEALSPAIQEHFGVSVEEFKQFCWDLCDSFEELNRVILRADKQFRNRNNEVK